MSLEEKTAALGAKVAARQQKAVEAIEKHLPGFPVDLIRATFDAKLTCLRSPGMDYGTDPGPGVTPGTEWIIPKPPKGDYPAVVAFPMTPQKRKYVSRYRLRRTRPASIIKP